MPKVKAKIGKKVVEKKFPYTPGGEDQAMEFKKKFGKKKGK